MATQFCWQMQNSSRVLKEFRLRDHIALSTIVIEVREMHVKTNFFTEKRKSFPSFPLSSFCAA